MLKPPAKKQNNQSRQNYQYIIIITMPKEGISKLIHVKLQTPNFGSRIHLRNHEHDYLDLFGTVPHQSSIDHCTDFAHFVWPQACHLIPSTLYQMGSTNSTKSRSIPAIPTFGRVFGPKKCLRRRRFRLLLPLDRWNSAVTAVHDVGQLFGNG